MHAAVLHRSEPLSVRDAGDVLERIECKETGRAIVAIAAVATTSAIIISSNKWCRLLLAFGLFYRWVSKLP